MLITGTPAQPLSHRRVSDGKFCGTSTSLIESEIGVGPQAFIVSQTADWKVPVHFHQQFQFQVIVGGGGSLGSHRLSHGSVHWTSPQSAYGPITSGKDGLCYITLRVLSDRGVWYLPESRSAMNSSVPKEHKLGSMPDGSFGVKQNTLLPLRADGLGAWLLRAEKDESLSFQERPTRSGRFYVVLQGSFSFSGQLLPKLSCLYWSVPDEQPILTALNDGSEVVIAQFPDHAMDHSVPIEIVKQAHMLSGGAIKSPNGNE